MSGSQLDSEARRRGWSAKTGAYRDDLEFFKTSGRRYRVRPARAEECEAFASKPVFQRQLDEEKVHAILGDLGDGGGSRIRTLLDVPPAGLDVDSLDDDQLAAIMDSAPVPRVRDKDGNEIMAGQVLREGRDALLKAALVENQAESKADGAKRRQRY